ncbi:MAG: glycosyltransferase family 2 protein [Methylobacter sp.]|uniref:glycosyltransferase family 2 protein n=1 Tax=Methylobacter sp. TaxID=2051955 RepID=UPI00272FA6D4|nr:glycosyltransferase family 2 protein [Methylobacter sp.]MDP1663604.1 glycosyltransferase family 2 protein [Methylobacter sp.]
MKISIVTISYNQVQFLERAICSIIQQDYDDLEYIVVDPGSTDGSRDIIERNRAKMAKVIYEPDRGPADGLNKGFSHASGDILGFINADDALLPGALRKVADYFERNPQADVVCGSGFKVDAVDRVIKRMMPTRFSKRLFIYGAVTLFQQGVFFRKSAFVETRGFNKDNRTCWDGELLLDMAINGRKFGVLYEDVATFRIHETSISGSGRLVELYRNDCNRLFMKAMRREMNVLDRLLIPIYRLEKWLINPQATLARIIWAVGGGK